MSQRKPSQVRFKAVRPGVAANKRADDRRADDKRAAALDAGQRAILEGIAAQLPMATNLERIARLHEA